MIEESNLGTSLLWTHVRAVRSENRKNHIADKNCKAFLSDEEREINFENLSERLQVLNVSDQVKTLSNEIINDGGEMFVYLNSCPAFHWQNFYHHLLFDNSNAEIILSVLNARKNSRTKGSKLVASRFLARMADILEFEYNRFENEREWIKNIAQVKGKQTRYFKECFRFCPSRCKTSS